MNLDKTKRLIMKPDKYQLDAIKSTKNTLLIAGAGAGKTFTIVEKIKYLVNEIGIKQEEILVISFTNKSVNDLKKKIDFDINIMTFHKLAMSVLDKKNINYNLVSDTELEFITNEYFRSIDLEKRDEILRFFKEYDYDKFLNSYKYIQFKKIIITLIKLYKTNNKNKDDIKKLFLKDYFLSKYTYIIKCLYDNELNSSNRLDFDDLIIKATQCLDEDLGYKYIIIDEFQDTSLIRFNLIKKIKELSGSTFFCVGDDYQSIYHFSGCDINIFLNFTKYIPNSEIKKLKYTYRNSQKLIDVSSKFVMKNESQIKKELLSHKHLEKPIEFVYYINPRKAFKKLYNKLKSENNDLLVLGRNNFDIKKFSNEEIREFMSVHSSKGLEAENVILINLTDGLYGFPNKLINSKLIEELHPSDKTYLYAEERRLFYVALTRTKNKVYILVPLFNKSIFIKELKKIIHFK